MYWFGKLYFDIDTSLRIHWKKKNQNPILMYYSYTLRGEKETQPNEESHTSSSETLKKQQWSASCYKECWVSNKYLVWNSKVFMSSPCFIQFKNVWIAEKPLFTYGIYDACGFHQSLGIGELTFTGKASDQFTEKLSSQGKTFDFIKVIQFNLLKFYSRPREIQPSFPIPFHFL